MNFQEVFDTVKSQANALAMDADLAMAITTVETGGNPVLVRFEPGWKYFWNIPGCAQSVGITEDTEKVLQAISWGPMQVMGAVARELGFRGCLSELAQATQGALYGVKKLKKLCDVYEDERAVIAAYNAGSPRKLTDGKTYVNQDYVDKVTLRLKMLRSLG